VGAPERTPRAREPRPSGRHFLKSHRIADELVEQAGVNAGDLVLEIGAGSGRVTAALTAIAGRVIAVEVAPDLASKLRRSFRTAPHVQIVEADILQLPRPREPFRAFGNVPFAIGTAILHWLLDDSQSSLTRADLLLQYEVARKRASPWPSRLLSLGWLPWWEFALVRRIPRRAFTPPPIVDAGMLRITRREPPLLSPSQRPAFVRVVKAGFRRSSEPVRLSLPGITKDAWKRLAGDRGLPFGAGPTELDVFDWLALYSGVQRVTGGISTRRL
jgi:23S rRNA (adenine-N6)-dimethyltransferase